MTTTSAYDPGGKPRRLERSRHDRWLTGVCGGLGDYLGVDPVIVRLVAIALVFVGGVGVVAYVAAFLLVPEAGRERPIVRTGLPGGGDRPWVIAGAVLLGIGALAFLDAIDFGWRGDIVWSLLLLGGGAYLLLRYTSLGRSLGLDLGPRRPPPNAAAGMGAPEPHTSTAPSTSAGKPGAAAQATSAGAPVAAPTMTPAGTPGPAAPTAFTAATEEIVAREHEPGSSTPFGGPPPAGPAPSPPPPCACRPRATRVALGAVLVIVGLGGVLLATGVLDLATQTFAAASVIVMGAALVVGAWWGGSPALVGIGLATAAVLGVVMAVDVNLDGGVGDRIYRPASASTVQDRYRLGVGRLWVDLRASEFPQGTTRIDTSLGVGELTVVVPDDVRIEASGSARIGELHLLGRERDGSDVEQTVAEAGPLVAGARRLLVDAEVGVGDIRVYRASDAPSPDGFDRDRGGGGIDVPLAASLPTVRGFFHGS